MPILSACCCWDTLEEGSRASAVFSAVTGVINTVIDVWLLYHLHYFETIFEENEKYALLVPGILFFIYLELACNLALIGLSFCLWIGVNRGYDGKRWIYSWVIAFSGFRIYEFLLGIYILAWLGAHRIGDIVYISPESLVIAIYWFLNTVLMIASILCVWSYWQDLMDDVYGKERRIKYFSMLSNIRHAARSSRSTHGTMTPRSYYMSQRSLAMSQASFPPTQQQMGPPIGASSQMSLPHSRAGSHVGGGGGQGSYPQHRQYQPRHEQQQQPHYERQYERHQQPHHYQQQQQQRPPPQHYQQQQQQQQQQHPTQI